MPPEGSGCGKPYPPPITRFRVKIHMKDYDYWVIDSTPLVTGPTGPCEHDPSGPFSVKAYIGGLYKACSEAGACGEVDVDRGL